ncbi:MAG: DUF2950 family protein [Candidatus Korobacteraceae bacterium]
MRMMSLTPSKPRLVRYRSCMTFALVALTIALPACHRKAPPSAGVSARGQETFATPEDAGQTLANAAGNNNQQQMLAIFGPDSKDVIYSGNAAEDKASLAGFVSAYHRMNRWRKLENGMEILLVDASNTAFPIPLRKDSSGRWFFDTAAGKAELTNRSLGRNELAAIDACAALADAQMEYFSQEHDGAKQYARKFISGPGKENGLYWPQEPGKPKSPLGPLVAFATDEGAKVQPSLHKPFHGYYFGMLTSQGFWADGGLRDYVRGGVMNRGFGFIAYPAQYGVSGVMTFVINQNGVIFQKDLGEATKDQAPFMTQFNPDSVWSEVRE